MTTIRSCKSDPSLESEQRNVNQRFYEETLGMRVLIGRRSSPIFRRCLKVEKIVLEESPVCVRA